MGKLLHGSRIPNMCEDMHAAIILDSGLHTGTRSLHCLNFPLRIGKWQKGEEEGS